MFVLQIKRVASYLWMMFLLGAGLFILTGVVWFREGFYGQVAVVLPATALMSILFMVISFLALITLRRGVLGSMKQMREEFDKRGRYFHVTEKMATLGRLAAGVAHEIRNPLTSIKMRLFSLQREIEGDSSQKEDLMVISEEVDRLESIVQNFLQFARPAEVRLEPIPVREAIDGVLELLNHRFESQEIKVKRERGDESMLILADRQQVRQVFMNILLNACNAMPDGGLINISCEARTEEGRPVVAIKMGNSGPPIPSEDAAHIFEPFFSTRDDGTGLGLSIAKQIVEQHGGRILLDEPGPGEGVRFVVTVPQALVKGNG